MTDQYRPGEVIRDAAELAEVLKDPSLSVYVRDQLRATGVIADTRSYAVLCDLKHGRIRRAVCVEKQAACPCCGGTDTKPAEAWLNCRDCFCWWQPGRGKANADAATLKRQLDAANDELRKVRETLKAAVNSRDVWGQRARDNAAAADKASAGRDEAREELEATRKQWDEATSLLAVSRQERDTWRERAEKAEAALDVERECKRNIAAQRDEAKCDAEAIRKLWQLADGQRHTEMIRGRAARETCDAAAKEAKELRDKLAATDEQREMERANAETARKERNEALMALHELRKRCNRADEVLERCNESSIGACWEAIREARKALEGV